MDINLQEVVNQLLVMVLIIGTGYGARKIGILDEHADRYLSKLVVNITLPALIIFGMTSKTEADMTKNLPIIILIASVAIISAYFVSRILIRAKNNNNEELSIYRFCSVFGNTGFLGFPLCYGLFGSTGLLYAAIYSSTQDLFFWSLGVKIISKESKALNFKKFINPCIVAAVFGIVMLFFKLKLPDFLNDTVSAIGNVTVPASLMVVGSGFCNVSISFKKIKKLLAISSIKLLLIPAAALIILSFLPLDNILKTVVLIEVAMPCSASAVTVAKNYERDYIKASEIVMTMTLFSLITIPLILLATMYI